jgi:hypothetical protein
VVGHQQHTWLVSGKRYQEGEKTMSDPITKQCVRCDKLFQYGNMDTSLRGQMTRKYCNGCITLQHRDESKLYQRELRLYIKKSQLGWEYLQRR